MYLLPTCIERKILQGNFINFEWVSLINSDSFQVIIKSTCNS